jgi:sulfatase maturation enzyme AslB (radical SAM superfamily)
MRIETSSRPRLSEVTRLHPSLPIFRIVDESDTYLYTPGHVADVDADIGELEGRAAEAVEKWIGLGTRPFEPECLTVYLSNKCNLACSYCYSAPEDPARARWRVHPVPERHGQRFPIVDEAVVIAAARVVAESCRAKGKRFSLIFHGGGEPTLHWELLQTLRHRVGDVAREAGLPLWSYLATNGVIPEGRVEWLARNFSLLGLSCDGPPDIQDLNRPAATGLATSAAVERTARRLVECGVEFHIRATITPASVDRQPEVVAYCIDQLGARVVRFEPAYQAHTASPAFFQAEDAERFVAGFLDARRVAHQLGGELHVSGVRVDEIHGPYCNPLRDVLQIAPDGVGSACFLTADGDRADDAEMGLGRYDVVSGTFVIDHGRAAQLRRRAARIPTRCESCVNLYHCARDCPDTCVITADQHRLEQPGFRCRVQKLLAHQLIREKRRVH